MTFTHLDNLKVGATAPQDPATSHQDLATRNPAVVISHTAVVTVVISHLTALKPTQHTKTQ